MRFIREPVDRAPASKDSHTCSFQTCNTLAPSKPETLSSGFFHFWQLFFQPFGLSFADSSDPIFRVFPRIDNGPLSFFHTFSDRRWLVVFVRELFHCFTQFLPSFWKGGQVFFEIMEFQLLVGCCAYFASQQSFSPATLPPKMISRFTRPCSFIIASNWRPFEKMEKNWIFRMLQLVPSTELHNFWWNMHWFH